jgi:hypothetical protein
VARLTLEAPVTILAAVDPRRIVASVHYPGVHAFLLEEDQ